MGGSAVPGIEEVLAGLLARAAEWFEGEGIPLGQQKLTRTVDMRYAGQNYELAVPVPDGPVTAATLDQLAAGFAAAHQRLYGFVADGEAVQLVTFRVEAAGLVRKAEFRPQQDAGPDGSAAVAGARDVWLPEAGGFVACPVYDRTLLRSGNAVAGPAIVEQMDTTTVLLPGMTGQVDPYLNLILEVA